MKERVEFLTSDISNMRRPLLDRVLEVIRDGSASVLSSFVSFTKYLCREFLSSSYDNNKMIRSINTTL